MTCVFISNIVQPSPHSLVHTWRIPRNPPSKMQIALPSNAILHLTKLGGGGGIFSKCLFAEIRRQNQ
jgi:hypothetical protein